MENTHKLGLYISYYLARFDKEAYKNLGYGNKLETHNKISELLSVKSSNLRNWRDEFDPLFSNRVGWYQRPMIASRIKVVQALENLDELQIREIVKEILSGRIQKEKDELDQLLSIVINNQEKDLTTNFILRGPTGRAAEEFFINYFSEFKKPIEGHLIDCRELGIGYDFRIETKNENYYVEVKGISDISGGVLFTNKEWTVAESKGDYYFLCIISNLREQPHVLLIQNPKEKLNPKISIHTQIQVNWSITKNQLSSFYD